MVRERVNGEGRNRDKGVGMKGERWHILSSFWCQAVTLLNLKILGNAPTKSEILARDCPLPTLPLFIKDHPTHRRRIYKEAKANCRRCFLGENGHPHASI